MSNHLISTAYKRDLRTPMRKSVMALLADKASDDGAGIYASKQTMADELCCSRQAVIDTIKTFLAEGLLEELGTRRVANGHTVEYAIVVDRLEALPLVKCHADRERRRLGNQTRKAAGRVKQVDPSTALASPVNKVDPNPPEPSSSEAKASSDKPDLKPEHVRDEWNKVAEKCGLAKVRQLDGTRLRKLRARLRDHPIEDWFEVFDAIERTPWMHGANERGWRIPFDFLLEPSKFNRLLEGTYDRSNAL